MGIEMTFMKKLSGDQLLLRLWSSSRFSYKKPDVVFSIFAEVKKNCS